MRNRHAAANYLSCYLSGSGLSRREVAERIGLSKPNALAMMAHSHLPIPLKLIRPLSEVLGCPPREFLSVWLEVTHPEVYAELRAADPEGRVLPLPPDELEVFVRTIPGLKPAAL